MKLRDIVPALLVALVGPPVVLLAAIGWAAVAGSWGPPPAAAQVPVLAPASALSPAWPGPPATCRLGTDGSGRCRALSPWAPTDATQLREARTPRSPWKCGRALVARAEHAARVGQSAVTLPRSCRTHALVLEPYRVVQAGGRDEIWRGPDQRLAVLAGSGPPKPTPPAVRRTRTTTREWTTWDRRLRARVHHREEVEEVLP